VTSTFFPQGHMVHEILMAMGCLITATYQCLMRDKNLVWWQSLQLGWNRLPRLVFGRKSPEYKLVIRTQHIKCGKNKHVVPVTGTKRIPGWFEILLIIIIYRIWNLR
jgi:hypothetical protein